MVSMRRLVLIGANGQLGTDLRRALTDFALTPLTHADLDVCDPARVAETLGALRPDVVVNTSAYHKVDVCEHEPVKTFDVNAIAVHQLARCAEQLDFTLVHFSSDYVFDGRAVAPYREDAPANPVNVYGASKLAGEHLIRIGCRRHFVIRTTGLYGVAGASGKGGNFVDTMVRLGRSGQPVRVVDDQVLGPTATADLAGAVASLLEHQGRDGVEYGLYHVTNAGSCSWYELARAIFERCGMRVDLTPITTAESGAQAKRPAYSVLAHDRWRRAGLAELRPWPDALAEYLRAKGHVR